MTLREAAKELSNIFKSKYDMWYTVGIRDGIDKKEIVLYYDIRCKFEIAVPKQVGGYPVILRKIDIPTLN
jgi:hypothetical protein